MRWTESKSDFKPLGVCKWLLHFHISMQSEVKITNSPRIKKKKMANPEKKLAEVGFGV